MASEEQVWMDVSVPLVDGMVHWPGNPPVSISRQLDRGRCAMDPRPGERILFKTANSPRAWHRDGFDEEGGASQALAGAGDNGDAAHRPLLEAGVWIVEGLDLSGVAPGAYELCCAPLRIAGCDASPVRALLRATPR